MKKLLFIQMLLLINMSAFTQPIAPADTNLKKRVDELNKVIATIKIKADSVNKLCKTPSLECGKPHLYKRLSMQQKLMVLSPIILSVLFILYCIIRLRKEDFKLSDALAGDNPVEREIENPKYDPGNVAVAPALITVIDYPKSSSRLIAFFSGLAAITIAISTVSYFFYIYFRTEKVPDFDKMYAVLIALGIGITPYAFNKVSKAINTNAAN